MKEWKISFIYKLIFFVMLFLFPKILMYYIFSFEMKIYQYLMILLFEFMIALFTYFMFELRLKAYYERILKKTEKLNKVYNIKNRYAAKFMGIDSLINFEYFFNEETDKIFKKLKENTEEVDALKKDNYTKFHVKEYQLKSVVRELEEMNDRLFAKEKILNGFIELIENMDYSKMNYDMFFEELLYYLEKYLKVKDAVVLRKVGEGYEIYTRLSKKFELNSDIIRELKGVNSSILTEEKINKLTSYSIILNLSSKKLKHGFLFINDILEKYIKYPLYYKIITTISAELINIANNLYYIEDLKEKERNTNLEIERLNNSLIETQDSLEGQLMQVSDMYEEIVTLYEVGKSLGRVLERKEIEEIVLEMILDIVEAEIGLVYYYSKERDRIELSRIKFINEADSEMKKGIKSIFKSSEMFYELKEKSNEIVVNEFAESPYYEKFSETIKDKINNFIEVPIYYGENISGAVFVINKTGEFTAGNISLITALTNQLGMAVQNIDFLNKEIELKKEEEQLKIASQIQSNLFPQKMPKLTNIEIYGKNVPAKAVGGDYYDFIKISDNIIIGIIADVSGKGIPAALLVSMVRTIFRMLVENFKEYSPEKILYYINNILVKENLEGRFVTALCFKINSVESTLEISNAGHDPVLFYDSNTEKIEEYDLDGTILGFMADEVFEKREIKVKRDDLVLFYTDGVVEARNLDGEFFEFDRLRNIIMKNNQFPADYVVRKLYREVAKFSNGKNRSDDITIICLKGV